LAATEVVIAPIALARATRRARSLRVEAASHAGVAAA